MKTISLFSITCLVCILTACQAYPTTPLEVPLKKVLATFSKNDTGAYRLDSLIDFDWDRLFMIRPYYHKALMKQECNIISKLPDSKIDNNDGLKEYLFEKEGTILSHHFTDNTESSIVLMLAGEDPNDATRNCGTRNTPFIFIKQIPNDAYMMGPDWKGKTFMIFLKE